MATKAGLDRAAVLQAAAAQVDANGLEELSLSGLAAHLGIRTPTLYHYFDGLPGLRRELTLLGLREIYERAGKAIMGKSGDDAIIALVYALRKFVKERPGLYAATIRAVDPGDLELAAVARDVIDIIMRSLASYHLSENDALHAVRMIRSIVHGVSSLENAGGFGLPLDVEETFRRLLRMFLDELPNMRTM